mgnify:CR=1 FL=1
MWSHPRCRKPRAIHCTSHLSAEPSPHRAWITRLGAAHTHRLVQWVVVVEVSPWPPTWPPGIAVQVMHRVMAVGLPVVAALVMGGAAVGIGVVVLGLGAVVVAVVVAAVLGVVVVVVAVAAVAAAVMAVEVMVVVVVAVEVIVVAGEVVVVVVAGEVEVGRRGKTVERRRPPDES